ncbi:hypothetical protein SSS_04372 [Sarcoptes scabiei]|nr:hypothetical protein SSS_04372 [Sarcoptes scabiei]
MSSSLALVVNHSIVSGFFASSASTLAKLVFTPLESFELNSRISNVLELSMESNSKIKTIVYWIVKFVCFGLFLLCNTLNWTRFSLALAHSSSTITVVAINLASNLIFNAIWMHFFQRKYYILVDLWNLADNNVCGTIRSTIESIKQLFQLNFKQ